MERIAQHKILVAGDSFEHCRQQVRKFFDLTSLVIYDCIQTVEEECICGTDDIFLNAIDKAEQRNRDMVSKLIKELEQTGAKTISDLGLLEHGYPSKVLHVLSHLMDGFVGIDSYFYNLLSDSHWVTTEQRKEMDTAPEKFWLIHIDCYSATPEEAGILKV